MRMQLGGNACTYINTIDEQYKNFKISPCLPYAHKYANEVTELGIFGTVNTDILPTYEGAQHATFLNEPQTTVYLPIQNPNPLYGINLANQFNNAGDISGAGSEDK